MNLIIAIIVAITVYGVQSKLFKAKWDEGLDVKVKFDKETLNIGETGILIETIENAKKLPLPLIEVKYSISKDLQFENSDGTTLTDKYHRNDGYSLLSYEKAVGSLSFVALKRGLYQIKDVNVTSRDLFFMGRFSMKLPQSAEVYVYPRRIKNSKNDRLFNQIIGEFTNASSLYEDQFIFRGLRDYQPGDTLNRINQKATARHDSLLVNTYEKTSEKNVKLVLLLEDKSLVYPRLLNEYAIELTSYLADKFLKRGISVSFETNALYQDGMDVESVGNGATRKHFNVINKQLAKINGHSGKDGIKRFFEENKQGFNLNETLLVVSPFYREELLVALDTLTKKGFRVIQLCPYKSGEQIGVSRPYLYTEEVFANE